MEAFILVFLFSYYFNFKIHWIVIENLKRCKGISKINFKEIYNLVLVHMQIGTCNLPCICAKWLHSLIEIIDIDCTLEECNLVNFDMYIAKKSEPLSR